VAQFRRQLILGSVLTALAILLVVVGVLDIPLAFVLVVGVVTIDYLLTQESWWRPERWPVPPTQFRGGGRTEVSYLAWETVNRDGFVSNKVVQRVRDLARATLAENGVTWSGQAGDEMEPVARARELLGNNAVSALTTTGDVRPRALENAVTRIEKLRKK